MKKDKAEDLLLNYKIQEQIRSAYRNGKRKITLGSDNVEFTITRGGPGNNYLSVMPAEPGRLAPGANLEYDRDKARRREDEKAARRSHDLVRSRGKLRNA